MLPPPPRSTLFPYTTLFRSSQRHLHHPDRATLDWPSCARRSPGGPRRPGERRAQERSEEHTSELQSLRHLVCRLLLEKKKKKKQHKKLETDHVLSNAS